MLNIFKSLQLLIPLLMRIHSKLSTRGITRHAAERKTRDGIIFVVMVLIGVGVVAGLHECVVRYKEMSVQNTRLTIEIDKLKAGVSSFTEATHILQQSKEIMRYNKELIDELVVLRGEYAILKTRLSEQELVITTCQNNPASPIGPDQYSTTDQPNTKRK